MARESSAAGQRSDHSHRYRRHEGVVREKLTTLAKCCRRPACFAFFVLCYHLLWSAA